jgi:hypothetical protein
MHLFFDVETTGMIDWKAPMLSPRQPRVVQLAAILDDAMARWSEPSTPLSIP